MISSKVIANSISPAHKQIITVQLCYPRIIHGELMTHRVFSRNAMSSRAIPVAKVIDQVRHNPFIPIHWGKNQPGMQANQQLEGAELLQAQFLWRNAAFNAANTAEKMIDAGLHKQIANRILEPFQWMHTIVTATEWANFFELRDHPDAEPHFQALAKAVKESIELSTPEHLPLGSWHLPYVSATERDNLQLLALVRISAARCARVSYLTHDGLTPDVDKDVALYERLVGSRPLHASPVEHQATPDHRLTDTGEWNEPRNHGNFSGWIQHRKLLERSSL